MQHDWNVTSDFIWMQLHHVLVELYGSVAVQMSTGSSSVGKSFNRRVQYLGEAAPAWSEGSGTFWATSHVPSSGFGCQRILHVKSVKELKTFTQKTHVNTMSSCTWVHHYLYLWVILHTNLICFQKKGYRPSSSSAARLARGHTSSAHARWCSYTGPQS